MASPRSSSSASDAQVAVQGAPYPYPSHVMAASFVNVELKDKNDYPRWKAQMMCLIESHDMLGFIDGGFPNPKENNNVGSNGVDVEALYAQWKRSDTLLKGWFFVSLGNDVLDTVISMATAKDVWTKIEISYDDHGEDNPETAEILEEEVDVAKYMPLCKAALTGDWEKAKIFFDNDTDAITTKIGEDGNCAIHYAVGTGVGIKFLENFLEKIEPELLLTMVNNNSDTALHFAACVGNTEGAKMLVKKNPLLLYVKNSSHLLPMHSAVYIPHKATTEYLLKATKTHLSVCEQYGYPSPFEGYTGLVFLTDVIFAGLFDVPVEESGSISNTHDVDHDLEKQGLAKRSSIHPVVQWLYRIFWEAALLHVSRIKRIQEEKMNHNKALTLLKMICDEVKKLNKESEYRNHYTDAIITAAINGSYEAVAEIIDTFPQAIWCVSDTEYSILQLAIVNRCEQVYNIFKHRLSDHKTFTKYRVDESKNNMLHLAGRLAPAHKLALVSGAALQMQRELQWYKEVEKFALPFHKEAKNSDEETPIMIFRNEHKKLVKDGEEWMKKTADSYTITATLIITIVFAGAITVPGGNNQDTGHPIFTTKKAFIIFVVSDAIALFTSTTSLLLFLSILTTRYAEEDFLYSLPKRLIIGLGMLFMSMTSMMIAFSATLVLMAGQGMAWILIPLAALTCLPVASFVTLQFPLLKDLISSTYGPGIFTRQSGHRVY